MVRKHMKRNRVFLHDIRYANNFLCFKKERKNIKNIKKHEKT